METAQIQQREEQQEQLALAKEEIGRVVQEKEEGKTRLEEELRELGKERGTRAGETSCWPGGSRSAGARGGR